VDQLRSRHPSGSILVVGHGGTNALLMRALLGLTAEETEKIHQDNSEVYLIEIAGAGPPVVWKLIPPDRLGDL
jgi:probable phosphoglycerate mutase